VLVVDDEPGIRTTLARALDLEGFDVSSAGNAAEGLALARSRLPVLVLLDLKLPDRSGLDLLAELRALPDPPAVVMMSGHGTLDAAVQATRLGAVDFLEKPIVGERLLLTVRNALQLTDLARTVSAIWDGVERRFGMVGESAALRAVRDRVRHAAPTRARVLITGESGVGKELVARAIHDLSRRAGGPFVRVNCGAIPDTLVESELLGYERGAFTGAERRRAGRFEQADGGTLFLDEIGELPLTGQAALLRVLQDGELARLGSDAPVRIDVRVIAATHRDLRADVVAGRFREDLYYRLAVLLIHVPPLRERTGDIPALAQHILERSCGENDVPRKNFTDDGLAALASHDWPGNVRELANLVDRLAILAPGPTLSGADVREAIGDPREQAGPAEPRSGTLYALLDAYERKVLAERIARFGGNMAAAAEDLGLERSHLYKKARKLGLRRDGDDG
jgi:DNA-binding NtrC family response regulator